MAAVAESAAAAEVVKQEVLQVKDRAVKLVSVIAAETAVAEVKLADAKPALDAAEAALQVGTKVHKTVPNIFGSAFLRR